MADANAFGKTSRFMAAIRVTEGSRRKIRALNTVENRLKRIRLRFYGRHNEIDMRKRDRDKLRMEDDLKLVLAAKIVAEQRSISKASDYHKALNTNYSWETVKKNNKHMVNYMEPDRVRERKAQALIDENRQRYQSILKRNRNSIDVLCPVYKPKWKLEQEDDDALSEAFGSRASSRQLSKTPTRAMLPVKKQEISRSMIMSPTKPLRPSYALPPIHNAAPIRRQVPIGPV